MNIKNKIRSAVARTAERLVRRSTVFRDTEYKLRLAEDRASRLDSENRELAERTSAIGRKLCRVAVQCPPEPFGRRLRVVVEIDAMILEHGFMHGNDATVINYIGRDIGARAAHAIRSANFQRWEV